jgi:hypothetical protein
VKVAATDKKPQYFGALSICVRGKNTVSSKIFQHLLNE